jgi:hypothetical protein
MNQVYWTELAKDTYAVLLQSLSDYSLEAAIELNDRVMALEDKLSQFRFACPASNKLPRFRRCVLSKHVSVVYEVRDRLVFIVAVLDNRSESFYF